MYGREAAEEYAEDTHVEVRDNMVMGMSCLIQGRETDRAIRFTPSEFVTKLSEEDVQNRPMDIYDTTENFWYLELGGTEDTIEKCDIEGYELTPTVEENGAKNLGHSSPMSISCEGHKFQIRDFADAILTGREPAVPLAESRRAVALIQGVYESARTKSVITLD